MAGVYASPSFMSVAEGDNPARDYAHRTAYI